VNREEEREMFVRILTPALIGLGVQLLFLSILFSNDKEFMKNLKEEHIVIHQSRAFIWVGLFDSLVSGTLLIWSVFFPNGTEALWIEIGFALFVLLGVGLVWVAIAWRVDVFRHEDYFLLRTIFLKKHKIQYCDCISYKITTDDLIIKTDSRTFRLDWHATNIGYLREQLNLHQIRRIM